MSGGEVLPDPVAELRRPSGASDVVPVRVEPRTTAATGVPNGLAGAPVAPAGEGWHPGHDTVPVGGAHRPRWDDRGARRRGSATQFGLTGRLVITAVFVLGLVWVVVGSVFSLLGIPPYLILMTWAMRDVWAKAPTPAPLPPGPASSATRGQSDSPR